MAQEIKYSRPRIADYPVGHVIEVFTNLYGILDPRTGSSDEGVSWDQWAASTGYTAGATPDIVKHGGRFWVANTSHSSTSTFDYTKWNLIEGIPDETFYAVLSGGTISNTESPINGESLVDARGLFLRGAGTNGTLEKHKGGGNYYSGGNPGSTAKDKLQNFKVQVFGTGAGASDTGQLSPGAPTSNGSYYSDDFLANGEGTPNVGDETAPAYTAVWRYIRIR